MMTTNFYAIAVYTVFVLVFMPSIIAYMASLGGVQFVKAGKVDDFCLRYALVTHANMKKIRVAGIEVDVSALLMYLVHGNSMSQFGVRNGQRVFVEKISNGMRNGITTHPMLMFNIVGMGKWQSQYKLRKFISYIEMGTPNWDEVYESNKEYITALTRDAFVAAMQRKQEKVDLEHERHILSVTYNEHSRALEYSLHPVSSLFGVVKYAA